MHSLLLGRCRENGRPTDRTSRGCAPTEIDQAAFRQQFLNRVDGGLVDFVRQREKAEWHRNILVGPPRTRCVASLKFPPLQFNGGKTPAAALNATVPMVWRTADAVETLVIVSGKSKRHPTHHLLEPLIGLLAVRASSKPAEGGVAAAQWWGQAL